MASKSNHSIAEQLKAAEIRITNSLSNDDVKAEVAKKGYTEQKLLEGKALREAASAAVSRQISLAGAAQEATALESDSRAIAHKAYQDFAKICRAKFKAGSSELVTLGLTGKEPKSTAEFIKVAYILFDNAKTDAAIVDKVKGNGYTVEFLTEERVKIENYEKANAVQVSIIGDAENATKLQHKALKELNEWISEYTQIARVALGDKEKLLEKIGISSAKRGGGRKKKTGNDSAAKK